MSAMWAVRLALLLLTTVQLVTAFIAVHENEARDVQHMQGMISRFQHVEDVTRSASYLKSSRKHGFLRKFKSRTAFLRSKSIALIPQPKSFQVLEGDDLELEGGSEVKVLTQGNARDDDVTTLETNVLSKAKLRVTSKHTVDVPIIKLFIDTDASVNQEKYELHVEDRTVSIKSPSSHGLFNGMMTLRQLLQKGGTQGMWAIPPIHISDEPVHEWRGLMLDVSRHFFTASEVKHLLQTMALYKLNRFHWHLSDDQGWRVPVEKYPKLTEVGAWRNGTQVGHDGAVSDDMSYGGFYTQAEMKDVVRFAKSLHIEVVPEIDSPGHLQAAIAAYPELGNTDASGAQQPNVATQFGLLEEFTMNPSDFALAFIDDVLRETSHLVDSRYFHVGGDDLATDQWSRSSFAHEFLKQQKMAKLENIGGFMTDRAIRAVNELGRRGVVWDDAMTSGVDLPKDTIVMLWRSWLDTAQLSAEAAQKGYSVVMCPQDRTHFDQWQSLARDQESYDALGGFLDLRKVYELDLDGKGAHVLGGQGQLWSEYIKDGIDDLDYKAWPRGIALAEATWCDTSRPGFDDFQKRLTRQIDDLSDLKVNFRDPARPKQPQKAVVRTAVKDTHAAEAKPAPQAAESSAVDQKASSPASKPSDETALAAEVVSAARKHGAEEEKSSEQKPVEAGVAEHEAAVAPAQMSSAEESISTQNPAFKEHTSSKVQVDDVTVSSNLLLFGTSPEPSAAPLPYSVQWVQSIDGEVLHAGHEGASADMKSPGKRTPAPALSMVAETQHVSSQHVQKSRFHSSTAQRKAREQRQQVAEAERRAEATLKTEQKTKRSSEAARKALVQQVKAVKNAMNVERRGSLRKAPTKHVVRSKFHAMQAKKA